MKLEYGDTVLYQDDIKSLGGREFLTDSVISLFLEILNETSSKAFAVSPSIVQLMKMTDENQLNEMFGPLELEKFDVVLLPVNDSRSVSSTLSGAHWSLLCYVRSEQTAYHIDSASSFNATDAKKIIQKLSVLTKIRIQGKNMCCSQQTNGHDCGVYVIYFARCIVDSFVKNGRFESETVQNRLPNGYRQGLLDQIKYLQEQN